MCPRTNFELFVHTELTPNNCLVSDSCGNTVSNNNSNSNLLLVNGSRVDFEKSFNLKYEEKVQQYGEKVEKMNARNEAKAAQQQQQKQPEQIERVHRDFLAVGTMYTQLVFSKISEYHESMTRSTVFKVLTRTTQPAHVIAVSIVLLVVGVLWPNFFADASGVTAGQQPKRGVWTILAYLTTFAIHFGAQVWMTFVSGLALYFSLPRHTFGQCQQVLFPKYFALNSVLSILTLILFVKVHGSTWEVSSYIQVIALTVCAGIELTVRLYLAKPLLRLMRVKYEYESKVGSGNEVGTLVEGDLVHCPHYQQIHKAFRKIHMMVAMGNMFAMVCTCVHLHYLASKIQII